MRICGGFKLSKCGGNRLLSQIKLGIAMLKPRSFVPLLFVFLSGCASVPPGLKFSEVKNEADIAVVYVYRLYAPSIVEKAGIKVDDVVVAELPSNSYTVLKLRSGTYTVKTEGLMTNQTLGKFARLSVTAGKSYYVNFGDEVGVFGNRGNSVLNMPDVLNMSNASNAINLTSAVRALSGEVTNIPSDLATCSYVAPVVSLLGPQ
jgi:hypothetical protein